ncbi:MAG TPA: zf-HC2 domain-containing protein [Planctomycetota bacterium]|nr:zf-HC2 domain-containing protein [Planctomycetota bacterium]
MTASCSTVLELLPWFVGDDLDATRNEAVRVHLRDCSSCRLEAAALQQATKALLAVRETMESATSGSKVMGVAEEPMFAAMHASIVQAVRTETANLEAAPRSMFVMRWLPLAAALMLIGVGCWLVRETSSLQVMRRRPIDMPLVDDVRVVPWAGPRVPLQPLGFEVPPSDGGADSGVGQGMMGRGRLRERAGDLGAAPVGGVPPPK